MKVLTCEALGFLWSFNSRIICHNYVTKVWVQPNQPSRPLFKASLVYKFVENSSKEKICVQLFHLLIKPDLLAYMFHATEYKAFQELFCAAQYYIVLELMSSGIRVGVTILGDMRNGLNKMFWITRPLRHWLQIVKMNCGTSFWSQITNEVWIKNLPTAPFYAHPNSPLSPSCTFVSWSIRVVFTTIPSEKRTKPCRLASGESTIFLYS